MREREDEWTGLMRAAISGDSAAYQRLLKAVTPVLRAAARRGLARAGQPVDQSEDIVQDILLAVHLKRHTWDADAPFAPWLFAIARNKLIDVLRRRGRRVFVNRSNNFNRFNNVHRFNRFNNFAFRHHHRFRNFAFVGAPFFDDYAAYGNYDYAAYGNECWRQEWTGYGWQWVNVCYGYGY